MGIEVVRDWAMASLAPTPQREMILRLRIRSTSGVMIMSR